ncbi:MAG: GGDEF domain-containing protein [Actinomycetota bacterium]
MTPAHRMPTMIRGIGYTRARTLVLWSGLGVLLVVAGLAYARRVDPVEVVATLLFIPVFVALLFWGIRGGLAAGVAAALAYVWLKAPAIEAVGFDFFARSIVVRALAFPLFGLIGGWAIRQLQSAVTKLELYDQIDDATGLFNARFFVEDTDLEKSRSDRYHTVFSVAVLDVPTSLVAGQGKRHATRALHDVGRLLRGSVRKVDRPVHGRSSESHRLAVVLPETGNEGAGIFARRLAERVSEHLGRKESGNGGPAVTASWVTYPGDDERLAELQASFREIVRLEHPDEPAAMAGPGPAR